MKREKPVVGQTVYMREKGYNSKPGLKELGVVKVGRKYFYTGCIIGGGWCREEAWHIDTWREKTDCTSRCTLYASVQEFDDVKEMRNMRYDMERTGVFRVCTLDQLRRIKAIIDEGEQ